MFKSYMIKEVCIVNVYVGDLLIVGEGSTLQHLLIVRHGFNMVNFMIMETNELYDPVGYHSDDRRIPFKDVRKFLGTNNIEVIRSDEYIVSISPIESK